MTLTPKQILAIDKARMEGDNIAQLRAALARAGHDPERALEEYRRTPLPDGRLRGDVNMSDPAFWRGREAG